MWRFQLQALSEKKSFLLKLSTASFVLHLFFLLIVFMSNQGYKMDVVKLKVHSAQVRFVPTFDTAKIAQSHKTPPKGKEAKKTVTVTSKSLSSSKGFVSKKDLNKNVSTGLHKGLSKKSALSQKKEDKEASKTLLKKVSSKVDSAIKKSAKTLQKKKQELVEKKVQTVESKHDFLSNYNEKFSIAGMVSRFMKAPPVLKKSVVDKKETIVQKPLVDEHNTVINNSTKMDQSNPAVSAIDSSDNKKEEVIDDVMYVSPREYNALMVYQDLQKALQIAWTPPPGISTRVSAQVTIVVDRKGSLTSLLFKKHSGSRVYDASIEHALQNSILPESVWSKTLTITFSP